MEDTLVVFHTEFGRILFTQVSGEVIHPVLA
jgi:hypothetical protein